MLDTSIFLVTFVVVLSFCAGYCALAKTSLITKKATERSIIVNTSVNNVNLALNAGAVPFTTLWSWTFENVGLALLFALCIFLHVEMDNNQGLFLTSAQNVYFDVNQVWNYAIARPLGAVIGAVYATLVPISNLVLYAPISAFWGTIKVLGDCGDPYALMNALAQIPIAFKEFVQAWINVFSTADGGNWMVNPIMIRPAVITLQQGLQTLMVHVECLCEFFAPTATVVTNVVAAPAVADAAQAAINIPWRILQFPVQIAASGYAFNAAPIFMEHRELFYNLGLFFDDVLEGALNILRMQSHLGHHITLPRPSIGMAAMRVLSGSVSLLQVPVEVIGVALGSGKSMVDVMSTKMAHTQLHLAILNLAGGVNSLRNLLVTGQPGTQASLQCDYYSYDFFKDNNIHGSIAEKCFCDDTSCGPATSGTCAPNGAECMCSPDFMNSQQGNHLSTCVPKCTSRSDLKEFACNNAANQDPTIRKLVGAMGSCTAHGYCNCTAGFQPDRFGTCEPGVADGSSGADPECAGIEIADVGHPIPCTVQSMGLAAVGISYTLFDMFRQYWTEYLPWKILETADGMWYPRMDSVTCAYRKTHSSWDQTIDPDNCKCDVPGDDDRHGVNFDPWCGLPTLNANVYSHLDALAFYAGSLSPYTVYGIPVPVGGIGWIPSFMNDNLGVVTTAGARSIVEVLRIATHTLSGLISYVLSVPASMSTEATATTYNLLQMPTNCHWGVPYDAKNVDSFYTNTSAFNAVQTNAGAKDPSWPKALSAAAKVLTQISVGDPAALEAMNRFYQLDKVFQRAHAIADEKCEERAHQGHAMCMTTNDDNTCMCNVELAYDPLYKCTCIAWYPGIELESEDMHGYYHSKTTSSFYHQKIPWCNSMLLEWQFYRAMEIAVGIENLFARLDSPTPTQTRLETPCYEDNKKNQLTIGDTTAVIKMFQPAEPGGNIYRFPGGVQRSNYFNEKICQELQQFAQPQWIMFDPYGGVPCAECTPTKMSGFSWFIDTPMGREQRNVANTKLEGNYIQNNQYGAIISGVFQPLRNDTELARLNSPSINATNALVYLKLQDRSTQPLPVLSLLETTQDNQQFVDYAQHFGLKSSTVNTQVYFPTVKLLKPQNKQSVSGMQFYESITSQSSTDSKDLPILSGEPVLKISNIYQNRDALTIAVGNPGQFIGPVMTDRVMLLHPETCGYAARQDQLIFRPCAHNCHTLGGQDICWCNVTIPTDFTCNVGQLLRQTTWTGIAHTRRIATPIISAMGEIVGGMTFNVAQGLCDMSRMIGTSAGAMASFLTFQSKSPAMTVIRHKLATLLFAGMDAAFMMPAGKVASLLGGGAGEDGTESEIEAVEQLEELDELDEEMENLEDAAENIQDIAEQISGIGLRRRLQSGDNGKGKHGLDSNAVMLTEFQAFLQQLFPEAMTGKPRPPGQESNALAILSSFVANMYFLWFKFACVETCSLMDGLQKVVFGTELDASSTGSGDGEGVIPAIEDFIDICIELLDDTFTELVVVVANVITGFMGMMFVGKPSLGDWIDNALRILYKLIVVVEQDMMTFTSMVIKVFPTNIQPIVLDLMTTLCVLINTPGAAVIDIINGAGGFLGLPKTTNTFQSNLKMCAKREDLYMSLKEEKKEFSQLGSLGFLRRLAEKGQDVDALWHGDTFCARYGRANHANHTAQDEWMHECALNRHRVEMLRNATGKDYWPWTFMDDWKQPITFAGMVAHGAVIYYTAGEPHLRKWQSVGYPIEASMDIVHLVRGLKLPGIQGVEASIPDIFPDYATEGTVGNKLTSIVAKVQATRFPNLFDQDWVGFNAALYTAGGTVASAFKPGATAKTSRTQHEASSRSHARRLQEEAASTDGAETAHIKAQPMPMTTITESSCADQPRRHLCTNCNVLDEFVNDIIDMAHATVDFYSNQYVPQISYLFGTLAHYQSTTTESNAKPYSFVPANIDMSYPGEQQQMEFMKQPAPALAVSTTHTVRNIHQHTDLKGAIKKFFMTRSDATVPIFGHSVWWYLQYPLRPCNAVDMAYRSCQAPKYSMADAVLLMFYVWLGIEALAWITGLALPAFVKWPVLGFAFLIFRYDYLPRCLPVLPLCLITDLEYMFTDAMPRCLCELVPALVMNYDKCTPKNCWNEDNGITYLSCPATELGILNPIVLLMKWHMPTLFMLLFSSWWSPLSVMQDWPTVQHYIADAKNNIPESPLDRTCAMLGLFDIILVIIALRIVLSMVPKVGKSTVELLIGSWAMFINAAPILMPDAEGT